MQDHDPAVVASPVAVPTIERKEVEAVVCDHCALLRLSPLEQDDIGQTLQLRRLADCDHVVAPCPELLGDRR